MDVCVQLKLIVEYLLKLFVSYRTWLFALKCLESTFVMWLSVPKDPSKKHLQLFCVFWV
jgi:hypothetical protein